MSWFLLALKKYAAFRGRSQRSEYWYFLLFYLLIVFVLAFVDVLLGTFSETGDFGLFSGLFMLAMLVPSLAVGVRRLHDIGRTGWWLLVAFVPIIGAIVLFVFAVMDSERDTNAYGPNPKALHGADAPA
ncbi:MAG: DUF805 domain-containing protein [Burkholderiaceae bacterium]|nr:DUF805 domain-containing protein [Burkholderiaceae bacterium]